MSSRERPLGVTILGILGILGSIMVILAGLGFAVSGATAGVAILTSILGQIEGLPIAGGLAGALIGGLGIGIGLFFVLIGLVMLFVNWKFLHGSYLAWALVLGLNVISLLSTIPLFMTALRAPILLLISLTPILINAIIIVYLLQPGVRTYLEGKPKEVSAYAPPPPPAARANSQKRRTSENPGPSDSDRSVYDRVGRTVRMRRRGF